MPAALTPEQKKERAEAKMEAIQAEAAGTPKAVRGERRRGVFNGTISKLAVSNQIEGHHLHWLNDEKGRIPAALEGGYAFVHPSEVNYLGTSANSDLTDKIKINVGTDEAGQPLFAYLMKIRQEWYDEDQALIQARVDKVDTAIRYGKNVPEGQASDSFYVPKGGISYANQPK